MPNKTSGLDGIARDVVTCRRCDAHGIHVVHRDSPLKRGAIGSGLVVVGICPGKTELTSQSAFSGVSGRRLMEWLSRAGLGEDREEIFSRVYFTSVIKCHASPKDIIRASRHCFPFMERQLDLIRPRVLMTLGGPPMEALFNYIGELNRLIGERWREYELHETFYPLLPSDSWVIPFPHPSPLSRWHNEHSNQKLLDQAIEKLRGSL